MKALRFFMVVFSLLSLYTSCLRAGWSDQHTALWRQAATPGTATRFGVPSQPACSQSLLCAIFVWQHEGFLHRFYVILFDSSCLIVFECWQRAVVREKLSS